MSSPLPLTVYTPTSALAQPRLLLGTMFRDLWAGRGLAWRLFRRDLSGAYRQSILGYLWAFIPPIATTATFVFLNSQQILSVGETPVPYPAYVLIGTLLWSTFVDSMNSPMRAVNSNRSMLIKINFPREALLLAGMADVLFNFMLRMTILAPVFWLFDVPVGSSILLFPLACAALMVLGLSIGLLLTPLGLLYTDIPRGLGMLTTFWMFLTPVIYPPPSSGMAAYLISLNPVTPVLVTARDWLTSQPATHVPGLLLVTAIALLVLFVAWIIYHVALPYLIERMGG